MGVLAVHQMVKTLWCMEERDLKPGQVHVRVPATMGRVGWERVERSTRVRHGLEWERVTQETVPEKNGDAVVLAVPQLEERERMPSHLDREPSQVHVRVPATMGRVGWERVERSTRVRHGLGWEGVRCCHNRRLVTGMAWRTCYCAVKPMHKAGTAWQGAPAISTTSALESAQSQSGHGMWCCQRPLSRVFWCNQYPGDHRTIPTFSHLWLWC